MSRLTFSGRIVGGKLEIDRGAFAAALAQQPDGDVEISVYRPHSDRARRYYFGVVVEMIADFTGHSPRTTHHHMKTLHNGGRSTRELDGPEFQAFTDAVIRWAAEFLQVVIPDPH